MIPLFHAWGDLLLSRQMARDSQDKWVEGLATRWTMQTAWSCFELACHLGLGLDPSISSQRLSPGFWPNLNQKLRALQPPIAAIDKKSAPWVSWYLIQEERHPFAHLGAGGGRFPSKSSADLAVEEAEKAIGRFFNLLGTTTPRWLSATVSWPSSPGPLRRATGGASIIVAGPTVTSQSADPSDPTTLRLAIIGLDDKETCDYYPAGYDWKPRVDSLLEGLGVPIKGIRVYDSTRVYRDEPVLMWGGEG